MELYSLIKNLVFDIKDGVHLKLIHLKCYLFHSDKLFFSNSSGSFAAYGVTPCNCIDKELKIYRRGLDREGRLKNLKNERAKESPLASL